jgi:RHS repeat-associated protein
VNAQGDVAFSGESAAKECSGAPPLGQPVYPQGEGWQEGIADVSHDGGRIGGYLSPSCRVTKRECPSGYTPSGATCIPAGGAVALKTRGTPAQCYVNPIEPGSGNKYQRELDYRGPGPFPLEFARTYNSAVLDGYRTGAPSLTSQWLHSYDREIRLDTNTATVSRQDGKALFFVLTGGVWVPDDDVSDRLERFADAAGNPTGWRYRTAEGDLVETYNAAGRLLSIANRAGLIQTLTYSTASTPPAVAPAPDMLISVADPFGRALSITYDDFRRIRTVTDPAGGQYIYTYDNATNNLAAVTYPVGGTRTYHYEDPDFVHALTGITDETGQRFATYGYDNQSRANLSEHAGGANRATFTYGADGSAVVIDALGATRTYAFQTVLGVLRYTAMSGAPCPTCGSAAQTYDANGNCASRADWNGNLATYQYDLARNLETSRTEASGSPEARTTTSDWHPAFRLPTRVVEPGRETAMTYDGSGNMLTRTLRDTTPNASRTWTHTHNQNGQVLTVDGPRTDVADVSTYTYFPNDDPDLGKRGNIATITNALGHVTQVTAYNAHGQPLTIVDPNGLTTTLAYDLRQRLTSRTVGSETTAYEYDGVGQLTKVTLPDGAFLSYTYDAAHRLTAIQDSLGNRIAYTLDAMGNRTREDVLDPSGALAQTRTRVYSVLNRVEREIGGTNPAAQITRYGYDNQGNVTSITDPLNRVTANAYDALNRLKRVTDPGNGVTAYGYDGLDQLISVTDPRNNATTYTLDGLGNLAVQSSPDTGATANTHDAAGNLITSTDAKGQSTSYTYDALNRVTRIVYDLATGTQLKRVDYAYDQGANGIGRVTSITETSAVGAVLQTTTYGYDQHGRVLSETRAIGGRTYTTAYAYDAAGRMTGMTYPSGRTTSHGFDALGRINRIETTGGGTTQVVVQDVNYHPFGAPKAFTFGNLQAYGRSFDLDGRIATHTLADQTKLLTLDAASRITRIERQGVPTSFADYGYDALDRLTNAVLPTSTFAFGYDPVGNRLSKSVGGSTDAYSYPPTSNRLAAITGSSGNRTYVHDANGSITGDGPNTYDYDARGRLVSAVSAAGTTSYQVNALGQRVRKTSTARDTIYHYDAQGRLIAESSPAGTPVREYLWLSDQPVAVVAAAQSPSGGGCAATPTLDTSNTFLPFAAPEGLEAHSGRLGHRGWEWRIGTNVRRPRTSDEADLDWVSGKLYGFRLTYDGVGNATLTVRDGQTELFTVSQTGGMDVGTALRFQVRSAAGLTAGNLLQASITSIDGEAVSETLQTAGDGKLSELARVFGGESLRNGFTVEGTVSLTFTGVHPPRGARLRFLVTAGNVTCDGPPPVTEARLYHIHTDHLNTPRVVTDESQRVIWRWENTEPLGKSPPEEDPDGDGQRFEMPLRFPGQVFDTETGLFYNYFRDYDPQTGRYVQSDPIGLAGGINPYLYAFDPLRQIDPLGLMGNAPGTFGRGPAAPGQGMGSRASPSGPAVTGTIGLAVTLFAGPYGGFGEWGVARDYKNTMCFYYQECKAEGGAAGLCVQGGVNFGIQRGALQPGSTQQAGFFAAGGRGLGADVQVMADAGGNLSLAKGAPPPLSLGLGFAGGFIECTTKYVCPF